MEKHNLFEEIPEVIKACCNLLIAQRERYDLRDDMIYNIETNKDGKLYVIKVEVKKDENSSPTL